MSVKTMPCPLCETDSVRGLDETIEGLGTFYWAKCTFCGFRTANNVSKGEVVRDVKAHYKNPCTCGSTWVEIEPEVYNPRKWWAMCKSCRKSPNKEFNSWREALHAWNDICPTKKLDTRLCCICNCYMSSVYFYKGAYNVFCRQCGPLQTVSYPTAEEAVEAYNNFYDEGGRYEFPLNAYPLEGPRVRESTLKRYGFRKESIC